jgi:hypothetical protein
MLPTVYQVEHERQVQQDAMDTAIQLLRIAVGSMQDDLTTLQMQLYALQGSRVNQRPLQANEAALAGQRLYREAMDKLWAELPFKCAEIVADLAKDNESIDRGSVEKTLAHFVAAAKPFWFDWEGDRCKK